MNPLQSQPISRESRLFNSILDGAIHLQHSTTRGQHFAAPSRSRRSHHIALTLPDPQPLAHCLRAIGLGSTVSHRISDIFMKTALQLKSNSEPHFDRTVAALEMLPSLPKDLLDQLRATYILQYRRAIQSWAFQIISVSQDRLHLSTRVVMQPLLKSVEMAWLEEPLEYAKSLSPEDILVGMIDNRAIAKDSRVSNGEDCITYIPDPQLGANCPRPVRVSRCASDSTSEDPLNCEPPAHSFPMRYPPPPATGAVKKAKLAVTFSTNLNPPLRTAAAQKHFDELDFRSVLRSFGQLALTQANQQVDDSTTPRTPHRKHHTALPALFTSKKSLPLSPVLSFSVIPDPDPKRDVFDHFVEDKHPERRTSSESEKPSRRRLRAFTPLPTRTPVQSVRLAVDSHPTLARPPDRSPSDRNDTHAPSGTLSIKVKESDYASTLHNDGSAPLRHTSSTWTFRRSTPSASSVLSFAAASVLPAVPIGPNDGFRDDSLYSPSTPSAADHLRRTVATLPTQRAPTNLAHSSPPASPAGVNFLPQSLGEKAVLALSVPSPLPVTPFRRRKVANLPTRRPRTTAPPQASEPSERDISFHASSRNLTINLSSFNPSPTRGTVSRTPSLVSLSSSCGNSPESSFDELDTPPATPTSLVHPLRILDETLIAPSSPSFSSPQGKIAGRSFFAASPQVFESPSPIREPSIVVKQEEFVHI